ncbi:membrane-spanning 4-domains subfamily A member 14 [Orycteropus afer afer]|uniref:Membrane-spanning 4-domains subfamily A member 14 n=1 Tax=Orycteropus afer afer TaxID=1230840 RepID=A0AC54ZEQ9_ORYAF|nr:membrane-spanning 4-domains subfamily A member 14 [Orycteropus afer afer]
MESSAQVKKETHAITIQPRETVLTGFPYRPHSSLLEILKGEPQVLGAVQILLALIIAGLGTIITFNFVRFSQRFPLVFLTGYPFWGAFTFILAGYFTGIKKKPQKYLKQSAMAINVLSSFVAIAGITLTVISYKDRHKFCQVPSLEGICVIGRTLLTGILSVLLIASIAEFSISVTIATFRNTCWTKSNEIVFFLPSDVTPNNELPAPEPNAQFQFELQEESSNGDTTTNTHTFFFGGYAFFKLRVQPKAQPERKVDYTPSAPVPDEDTELRPLPPILEKKSSGNITCIQPGHTVEHVESEDLQPPKMQIQLLQAQTFPLQVFSSHSVKSDFHKTQDLPSYALPCRFIESQALKIKGPLVPTSQVLFVQDIPSQSLSTRVQESQAQVVEAPLVPTMQVLFFQDLPSYALPSRIQEPQALVIEGPLVPTTQVLLFQDSAAYALHSRVPGSQMLKIQGPIASMSQALFFQDLPLHSLTTRVYEAQSQVTEGPLVPTSQVSFFHDTLSQAQLYEGPTSHVVESHVLASEYMPVQDISSEDFPSQVIPLQTTPPRDTSSQDTPSQDTLSKDTSSQDTPSQELSEQVPTSHAAQSPDQQFKDLLYQDIRSEVLLLTQEWNSEKELHGKKSLKRHSLVERSKGWQSPKRRSLDQQSPHQKPPKRKSLDQESQGQESPRRKSVDQQIRDWLFPKRRSLDEQSKSLQSPRKQSSSRQVGNKQMTMQQPPEQQAEDQQTLEEQSPKQEFPTGQGEDQQPPELPEKCQQADEQQPPKEKPEESQAKGQKAQEKKAPKDLCKDWKLQIPESQDRQHPEMQSSYWKAQGWQYIWQPPQDWMTQSWRNKDWKAQEWRFETQNSLNWQSQNLLEKEALRQRALYQEAQTQHAIARHNLGQQLQEGPTRDSQCPDKLQQDLQSRVTQKDLQVDRTQIRDITPGYTKFGGQPSKDLQSENMRSNFPPSCGQHSEQDPYFTYLPNLSSEQNVEINASLCSTSYKEDLDLATTSCYLKDQRSEDSD